MWRHTTRPNTPLKKFLTFLSVPRHFRGLKMEVELEIFKFNNLLQNDRSTRSAFTKRHIKVSAIIHKWQNWGIFTVYSVLLGVCVDCLFSFFFVFRTGFRHLPSCKDTQDQMKDMSVAGVFIEFNFWCPEFCLVSMLVDVTKNTFQCRVLSGNAPSFEKYITCKDHTYFSNI